MEPSESVVPTDVVTSREADVSVVVVPSSASFATDADVSAAGELVMVVPWPAASFEYTCASAGNARAVPARSADAAMSFFIRKRRK